MKILILLEGYFPAINYGGPPVSINNLCKIMPNKFDKYIVANDHEKNDFTRFENIHDGWNLRDEAKVYYLKRGEFSYKKLKSILLNIKPDLIYINSLFNAKHLIYSLMLTKKLKIRILIAPRGELYKNALKMKWYKKMPYLFLLKKLNVFSNTYFQATSESEYMQIIKHLKVPKKRIIQLENIPTLPIKEYKKELKKRGKLNCIFLSRIHPKKNLHYTIDLLKELNGEIIFDIYGYIEDKTYWADVEKEISRLPSNVTVKYCGIVEREEIHYTFSKYDIFIFPTLGENYGQVIAESILSNCPVIISDNTPWSDINNFKCGWAISLKNKNEFIKQLQYLVELDQKQYIELLKRNKDYINKKLNLDIIEKSYEDALINIISN